MDHLFVSTNGPAYEKSELRRGPPLEYVGEKLHDAIVGIHTAYRGVASAAAADGTQASIELSLQEAFYKSAVAYLALYNLLSLANNRHWLPRLLAQSRDELQIWLDMVSCEGSVNGDLGEPT